MPGLHLTHGVVIQIEYPYSGKSLGIHSEPSSNEREDGDGAYPIIPTAMPVPAISDVKRVFRNE